MRSKTFTTDSAPGHEAIQAMGVSKRIRIREKPAAGAVPYVGGTAGYQVFGVKSDGTSDAVPMTRYAGEETVLELSVFYTPGQTAAFISALAGTITMEQIEE